MVIAVFDVDKTLLRGDSLLIAARKSTTLLNFILYSILFIPSIISWKLKKISTKKFKEKFLKTYKLCQYFNCKEKSNDKNYLLKYLVKNIRKGALVRLVQHKENGDKVFLCSASPEMILEPLATFLGVDLISTKLIKEDNKWLPKIKGENCSGKEKVIRLEEKIGKLNEHIIESYGDSAGDQDLLNISNIPHFRNFSNEPKPYPSFKFTNLIPLISIGMISYTIGSSTLLNSGEIKYHNDLLPYILIGQFMVLIGYLIRFIRWRFLLKQINLRPPILIDGIIWMGSYAFTATPGKAGEALRCIILKEKLQIPAFKTFIALIIERITDGISVVVLLLLNITLIPQLGNFIYIKNLYVIISSIVIFLVIILFLKNKIIFLCKSYIKKLISKFEAKREQVRLTLSLLMRPDILLFSTLLGILSWSLEGVSLMILLKGMGISLPFGGATIAHIGPGLFGAFTFIPGGLGATEAGTIALLSMQSVPIQMAASATLLIRIMTLWFATILGVFCLSLPLNKILHKYINPKNKERIEKIQKANN